jgi:hypothetical protein
VPRQEQIHHGKSKFITAKANSSRQKQIHHARANSSRQEQITHGKSKLVTARANYSRQNKNQITGQRFGQRLLHLPLYNFMLCKHYSLSVNIPKIPGDPLETKRKQNKTIRKIRLNQVHILLELRKRKGVM